MRARPRLETRDKPLPPVSPFLRRRTLDRPSDNIGESEFLEFQQHRAISTDSLQPPVAGSFCASLKNILKMGIRGLTTYINSNPRFMENHQLHGGYLVIDGLAVASHLFFSAGCNSSFAGDLDKFSHRVSIFLDQLSKCELMPVVMLDGGSEDKKLDTLAARKSSHMEAVASYTPASEARVQIGSMALSVVFEAVLKERGVMIVRCVFEADASIAAVAGILDCPVLSNDSDFYIFGVKYIPVDSLAPLIGGASRCRGYAIPCKMFRPECISRSFPGLDLSALPLTAVLLGNDYTTRDTFERFFAGMRLSRWNKRLYSTEQRKIDTVFRWLRNYNLDDATAAILSKMPKNRREELLRIIELVVNGYLVLPFEMLEPLGLAEKYRTKIAEWRQRKRFHFSRNVETLDAREFWSEEELAAIEDSSSEEETVGAKPVPEPECAGALVDSWPAWFARHYHVANLPAYFVDMMTYGEFDVPVQMENFEYPSAHSMSMKIVGVIHGLLVAGRPDKSSRGLSYTIRDGTVLVDRHADTVKGTRTMTLPALSDLVEAPRLVRKRIFDDTLEISGLEALVDDVPVEWRLYVIAIVYWMRQPDEPSRNSCHMHAVLFAMLSGVVDRKIGFRRSMKLFHERYAETLRELKSKRQGSEPAKADEGSDSIVEALKSVRPGDCLLAAPIIIELCNINEELCDNRQNFNVTIVHVFAQLLSCTTEAIHLNSLLGYPYQPLNIGDCFNGTMLYNLFTRFEKLSDVEAYNCEILKDSPSIRHLLELLTAKVKEIIALASLGDCGSTDARKLSDDEPSKVGVLPDEGSTPQAPSIDLQDSFSTLGI